mgnify:CR=1 FL=1
MIDAKTFARTKDRPDVMCRTYVVGDDDDLSHGLRCIQRAVDCVDHQALATKGRNHDADDWTTSSIGLAGGVNGGIGDHEGSVHVLGARSDPSSLLGEPLAGEAVLRRRRLGQHSHASSDRPCPLMALRLLGRDDAKQGASSMAPSVLGAPAM